VGKTKLLANMLSEIEAEYRHGFNDAVRAALKAVKGLRPSDPNQKVTGAHGAEPFDPLDPAASRAQSQPTRQLRENSDQMRVLQAIRTTPGMRGVEILHSLKTAGPPVHERTLRTALARLKQRSFIEQREGLWYAMRPTGH
jgi:hypothetical protein